MSYQDHIIEMSQLIKSKNGTWDGINPESVARMRLQNLAAELTRGATVVLVTHDPLEALRLADRIIVLTGAPARVAATLEVDGPAPRDPGDPDLARRHGELLGLLMAEAETAPS